VNFAAKVRTRPDHATLTQERANELKIPMTQANSTTDQTAFTISIEAKEESRRASQRTPRHRSRL
jgi:3,4-dihydroxy-2-butanone 4-phosphate synthase